MQYGGQDRELGERLVNYGIKPKQIRYSTVCLHLDHPRGYATPESINKNKNIRKETKIQKKKWTDFGIEKEKSNSLELLFSYKLFFRKVSNSGSIILGVSCLYNSSGFFSIFLRSSKVKLSNKLGFISNK